MFKPLYGVLAALVLVGLALPLAAFAFFTSMLAFSTLLVRASVVYLEIGIALVYRWLFVETRPFLRFDVSRTSRPQSQTHSQANTPASAYNKASSRATSTQTYRQDTFGALNGGNGRTTSPRNSSSPNSRRLHSNHRRGSSSSHNNPIIANSAMANVKIPQLDTTSQTPTSATTPIPNTAPPDFSYPLKPSQSSRDFEGLGGWRLAGDTTDEAAWTRINSRLELPLPLPVDRPRRHHSRTSTSGSQRFGSFGGSSDLATEKARRNEVDMDVTRPAANFPSNTSRSGSGAASSTSMAVTPDGYFAYQGDGDPEWNARMVVPPSPEEVAARHRMDERRRSVVSTTSSSGSVASMMTMTQGKADAIL